LDALQAGVLRVKLKYLDRWAEERRRHAAYYTEKLRGLDGITPPVEAPGCYHVFNQYTVRISRRDEALPLLRERQIGCAVYYPIPLHLQPCFRDLGYPKGSFPVTEQASNEVVSLPVYPELTCDQQDEVLATLCEHLSKP